MSILGKGTGVSRIVRPLSNATGSKILCSKGKLGYSASGKQLVDTLNVSIPARSFHKASTVAGGKAFISSTTKKVRKSDALKEVVDPPMSISHETLENNQILATDDVKHDSKTLNDSANLLDSSANSINNSSAENLNISDLGISESVPSELSHTESSKTEQGLEQTNCNNYIPEDSDAIKSEEIKNIISDNCLNNNSKPTSEQTYSHQVIAESAQKIIIGESGDSTLKALNEQAISSNENFLNENQKLKSDANDSNQEIFKSFDKDIISESNNILKSTIEPSEAASAYFAEFEVLKSDSQTSIAEFENLLSRVADEKDFPLAFKIFNLMGEAKIERTPNCYSQVVRAGRRVLRLREIRILFGEDQGRPYTGDSSLKARDSESNVPDSAFFADIKGLIDEMRSSGLELTVSFYEDLASHLSAIGQAGLLINIAVTMEKRGIQPSTSYYNKMLFCLPRTGLSDRADTLFARMISSGVTDQTSYAVRIGSLVYQGRIEEAESVFLEMKEKWGLNRVACNSMIHGYLGKDQITPALQLFEEMKASSSVNLFSEKSNHVANNSQNDYGPDNITANTFVTYYYSKGNMNSASAVLEYFYKTGVYPREMSDYGNLIKLNARYDENSANQLISGLVSNEEKAPLDAAIYNAVLVTLLDRQVSGYVKGAFGCALVRDTYEIKKNSLASLLSNCTRDFRQIVARMEEKGVAPTSVTYELALRALRAANDHMSVLKVFDHLQTNNARYGGNGVMVYSSHRNLCLQSLISIGNMEKTKSFVNHLIDRRHVFNDNVSSQLVSLGIPHPRKNGVSRSTPNFEPRHPQKQGIGLGFSEKISRSQ